MNISEKGLKFLSAMEGGVHRVAPNGMVYPYDDARPKRIWSKGDKPKGYLTIGVGHLLTDRESVSVVNGVPMNQALALFHEDVEWAVEAVDKCWVELAQWEFDALVSFVFNVGAGAFNRSTLLRQLRGSESVGERHDIAQTQLKRWNRSGGRKLKGLIRRRREETELFCYEDYTVHWIR